ncbi:MAG: UV DNA damage repair endonuclease UvsE [Gemmatimonadales bacterium]|nr:UV DNA damage repair endonuclease UvsE [Gemmatimonadales bacterium]
MDNANAVGRLRWGLCCQFLDAPIRFRTATHRYVSGLAGPAGRAYLTDIARDNAASLRAAVVQCAALGIGAFRMNSQILPLGTHPDSGYRLADLDPKGAIARAFRAAGALARKHGVRLSFHPDQFVVLNSEREEVVRSGLTELAFQAGIARLVGADTMVVHGGGCAGGKAAALDRLERGIDRLAPEARARLALENDDRQFTPADLLPLCDRTGVPLVYDVHHHRCNPDGASVEEVTDAASVTWKGRGASDEQWVHISSPRDGWTAPNPRPHAACVDPEDFPAAWLGRALTIDVEAKAKERAVIAIRDAVAGAQVLAG